MSIKKSTIEDFSKNEKKKTQKKTRFFLMSQGSLNLRIRFLGQKVFSEARVQTCRQTRKWIQRTPFQGFRNFSFNLSSRVGPLVQKVIVCFYHSSSFSIELWLTFFCSFVDQWPMAAVQYRTSEHLWAWAGCGGGRHSQQTWPAK